MNYYKRHLGDYAAATRHLSMLEHGAYTLLLDLYYITEKPLPTDEKTVFRLVAARSPSERAAVRQVMSEFFELRDDGWHQNRCDEELAARQEKADKNREIGKLGGRPRKTKTVSETGTQTVNSGNPNGFREETQMVSENNPSHKPIANNQEPIEAASTPPPEARAPNPDPPPPLASDPIPDQASARGTQIAVLLRRNGADPATHPGSRGIATLVEMQAADAQVLTALETAKQRRREAGSAQAVNASYLVPIVRELQAEPPPGKRQGRFAEDIRQMRKMSAWADEQLRNQQAERPASSEADMGAIDANRGE